MLASLIAFGVISEASAAPSDFTPITATGAIVSFPEQKAFATKGEASTVALVGSPENSAIWTIPLDPSDRAPYVMDWTPFLLGTARIASVQRITVSAAGVAAGLTIETGERAPIIGTDGKAVRLRLRVADDMQNSVIFTGEGVQVAIAALIRTNAAIFDEYERTWILTVKQG